MFVSSRLAFAGMALLCLGTMSAQANAADSKGHMRLVLATMTTQPGNPYQGITLPAIMPMQALYDTMTMLDDQGRVIPALAVEWRAEGPTTWAFKLRDGVVFSNGEKLDAAAVVTSVERIVSPAGRAETIGSTLYQVKSASVVDTLTVRIELSEADPLFPLHVAAWRVPAPAQTRQLSSAAPETVQPIGSGPFVLDSHAPNKAVLKANPTSWRKAKLDELTLTVVPEEVARVQALASGATDIAYGISLESKDPVMATGAAFQRRFTSQVYFLAFATEGEKVNPKSPLADMRVRRALNMAVNRENVVLQIFGDATKASSQLSFPGAFGYDPSIKPIPYDPVTAKKLLAEAGYPNGFSMKMGASSTTGVDTAVYQLVAAELQKIGVQVEVLMRSILRQQQDMFLGKLDVEMFNTFTRGNDPLMDYRHRACIGVMPERHPYHCDAQVTALLAKVKGEVDLTKRAELYHQVVAREQESPPGIFLWQNVEFDGVSQRVKAYAPFQDQLNMHLWEMK